MIEVIGQMSLLSLDITEGVDPKFDTPQLILGSGCHLDIGDNTKVIVRD